MNRIAAPFAASALALSAATALAAPADERLAGAPLPGFVVGHSAANDANAIVEQVPAGESVQRWTRMVTTQSFGGLAARTTPAAYARTIADSVPRACPGATISPIAGLQVSGRPAARIEVACPRSAGGIPETFVLLAVAGRSTMYVKQVAFRGAGITPANLAWGRGFLGSIVLCGPGDRQSACR